MTAFWRARQPLLLASQSQARQSLLAAAGIPFEACAAGIDERAIEAELLASGATAPAIALRLSRAKALAVGARHPDRLVAGADQVLGLTGRLFGKPANREAAREQLLALSGRTHELHSGCSVARGSNVLFETVSTARLRCRQLSEPFVEAYVEQAEGLESAGAYRLEGLGIQLFEAIEGDYATVLGLPLLPLLAFLRAEGSLLS